MRLITWLFRAFIFFTLFAFALNNQHDAGVRWFFGREWHAPMVFIVLAAFGIGCAFGVFAMVPSWWKHRRAARQLSPAEVIGPPRPQPAPSSSTMPLDHPPRDGL